MVVAKIAVVVVVVEMVVADQSVMLQVLRTECSRKAASGPLGL